VHGKSKPIDARGTNFDHFLKMRGGNLRCGCSGHLPFTTIELDMSLPLNVHKDELSVPKKQSQAALSMYVDTFPGIP
jgi:hypothetical protein